MAATFIEASDKFRAKFVEITGSDIGDRPLKIYNNGMITMETSSGLPISYSASLFKGLLRNEIGKTVVNTLTESTSDSLIKSSLKKIDTNTLKNTEIYGTIFDSKDPKNIEKGLENWDSSINSAKLDRNVATEILNKSYSIGNTEITGEDIARARTDQLIHFNNKDSDETRKEFNGAYEKLLKDWTPVTSIGDMVDMDPITKPDNNTDFELTKDQQDNLNQSVSSEGFELSENDFPLDIECKNRPYGLPPMWEPMDIVEFSTVGEFDDKTGTSLDTDLAKYTFPILEITPLDQVELSHSFNKTTGKFEPFQTMPRYNRTYYYAIDNAENSDISYTHSNTYNSSALESFAGSIMKGIPGISDLYQLSQVGNGAMPSSWLGAYRSLKDNTSGFLTQFITDLAASNPNVDIKGMFEPFLNKSVGLASDLLKGAFLGAKFDLPNVWVKSQTNLRWNFNIRLKTMCGFSGNEGKNIFKNTNHPYYKEFLLPLYTLLRLSLPVTSLQFANSSFLNPPYLSIRCGSLINSEICAITNLNLSFPQKEMNFYNLPTDVHISLTIEDMYNILVQSKEMTLEDIKESEGINAQRTKASGDPIMPTLAKFFRGFREESEKTMSDDKRKTLMQNVFIGEGGYSIPDIKENTFLGTPVLYRTDETGQNFEFSLDDSRKFMGKYINLMSYYTYDEKGNIIQNNTPANIFFDPETHQLTLWNPKNPLGGSYSFSNVQNILGVDNNSSNNIFKLLQGSVLGITDFIKEGPLGTLNYLAVSGNRLIYEANQISNNLNGVLNMFGISNAIPQIGKSVSNTLDKYIFNYNSLLNKGYKIGELMGASDAAYRSIGATVGNIVNHAQHRDNIIANVISPSKFKPIESDEILKMLNTNTNQLIRSDYGSLYNNMRVNSELNNSVMWLENEIAKELADYEIQKSFIDAYNESSMDMKNYNELLKMMSHNYATGITNGLLSHLSDSVNTKLTIKIKTV